MSLPSTIDTAFVNQYGTTIYTLAQQRISKFVPNVRLESVKGDAKAFDRLGEAEIEEITTRHPATPNNELPHTRRWVQPTSHHTGALIDDVDKLQMLINPENEYQNMQAAALRRQMDDTIIDAATANAAAGNTPTSSSVAFEDDSISIDGDGDPTTLGTLAAVATVADIGIGKITLMQRIFNDEDVDAEIPKFWGISPKSVQDLLNLEKIGSADYNTIKALQAGNIEQYCSFNFFWTTRLNKDAATETAYRSIAWAKDGIIFGRSEDIFTRISEESTLSYATRVYARITCGAVRMDGAKVHECLNGVTS